jgi:hypothetical protein
MQLTTSRLFVLVLIVMAVATYVLTAEPPTRTLRLVRPALELEERIGQRLVSLIHDHERVNIVLVDRPSPDMTAVDAVKAGHADLALAANIEAYQEDINVVLPLYARVLHIVTRLDPVPESLDDLLQNRQIYAGPAASLSYRVMRDIVDDLGDHGSSFVMVDDPKRMPDVAVVFAPIDRQAIISDARLDGLRLFSFGEPADLGKGSGVDSAVLLNPRLKPFVIPAGTYNELTPAPVLTLAVDNLLVAHRDLPQTVVYDLLGEIVRVRTALFSERPELFQPLDKSVVDANFAFSMHPGAMAYLLQDEPTYIERYSGVAEVLVTLLIGLVSGGWALLNIFRIRRKNRIDAFYLDVIKTRDSVPAGATPAQKSAAIAEIRELQNRAFELLVDERLAADESFRIFIELTNNSIAELSK